MFIVSGKATEFNQRSMYLFKELQYSLGKFTLEYFMYLPNMETKPQSPHTNNEYWIEPVLSKSPVGETKIPDPIMVPTIKAMPLNRSTLFFNLTPLSSVWTEGFELDLSLGSFSEQPCCDPLPLVGLGMAKNRSFKFVIFWQNQGNLLKSIDIWSAVVYVCIQMSHWHCTMVNGTRFWISCQSFKILKKVSCW